MTVLVIGGNGFLGSHIVDGLLDAGHDVRVLAPHPEIYRAKRPQVVEVFGRSEVGFDLDDALRGCTAVVDAGSSAVPATAQASPAVTAAGALGASCWLAERCARSGVEHLVYLSSGGTVYAPGSTSRAHLETDAIAPQSVYGALKASTEMTLTAVLRGTGTAFTSLRIANAFGERQNPTRPQGIVIVGFTSLLHQQRLALVGGGSAVRDFVYAGDVAALVPRVLGERLQGAVNVGTGVGVRVSAVLQLMERVSGRSMVYEHLPSRDFDAPYSVLDSTRARNTGWRPTVDLETGLALTWAWLQKET